MDQKQSVFDNPYSAPRVKNTEFRETSLRMKLTKGKRSGVDTFSGKQSRAGQIGQKELKELAEKLIRGWKNSEKGTNR